jgi:Fungal specific transcription factor domain
MPNANNYLLDIGKGNFIYTATDGEYGQRLSSIPGILSVESLSKMPQTHRYLLHFFLNETSRIISCHDGVWKNLCQTLIPMAVEHTCLLSAVLALSGNYLLSSGISSQIGENTIVQLKSSSIVGLRSAVNAQKVSPEVLLSTAMLLCLCDIHSGADSTASWRVHFQGSQALIPLCGISYSVNHLENQDTSRYLLAQMYTSIEMIVSLTTKGLPKGQCNQLVQPGNPYIDEYFGVSTDLLGIIYEIGAAAAERRRMDGDADSGRTLLCHNDLLREADYLEQTVCNMIFRDQKTPTPFHPRVEKIFSPEEKQEYILCNEAYQQTALINILRRVRKLPITSPRIQVSVQRILEIASQMNHTSGLSPWLLMSTPLFTAGSVSLPVDRQRARNLMVELHEKIRISNYRCSLGLLDLYWKKSDEEGIQDVECVLGLRGSSHCLYESRLLTLLKNSMQMILYLGKFGHDLIHGHRWMPTLCITQKDVEIPRYDRGTHM